MPSNRVGSRFLKEIEKIEDHRVDANKDYELVDIIFLVISAVLCGAKGWKEIEIFGVYQTSITLTDRRHLTTAV